MFEQANEKSKKYFESLLNQHGPNYMALAYGSEKTQEKKFLVLSEVGDLRGKSVLDVGCGFGDLAHYLKSKGIHYLSYTGVDISPEIIKQGKLKYPGLKLVCVDILAADKQLESDYVVSTGFNCHNTGQNHELERAMLKKMYSLSRIGCAVGFESSYSPFGDGGGEEYLSNPLELFDFCKREITPYVSLIHNYMPHDFTLYLYKEQRGL